MEEAIALIILVGTMCIICFFLGAKIVQKVVRQEPIELPKIKPIKSVRDSIAEYNESKEIKKEQERYDIIGQNIDSYDGTPYGQQDIPK